MDHTRNRLAAMRQSHAYAFQPLQLGQHGFPGLWAKILPPELLRMRLPYERRASCSRCPKAALESFRPDYRCCTYHPRVPNFMLGLAGTSAPGAAALERARTKGLLLPEGMYAAPAQWLAFMEDQDADLYGKSHRVLCPLLDTSTGLCGIYAFRNAVCSTFFCYHDHGEVGQMFWSQLQTLGSQVELVLGQWSLRELGFDVDRYLDELNALGPQVAHVSTTTGWSEATLDRLWGNWRGQEQDLYQACAALLLEHENELWAIACREGLREAITFERAVDALYASNQEAPESEEGETIDPALSWKYCQGVYQSLWAWPLGQRICLDERVVLAGNQHKSAEERYAFASPYFLDFTDESGREWQALSHAEWSVLQSFVAPGDILRASMVDAWPADQADQLRDAISAWLARGILKRVDV